MYQKVIEYIQSRISISQPAKGQYLLRIGEYCRFIGFLNKGLIITAFIDNAGKEKASNFICEGCFFTYTEGLAANTPSHKNLIALEECETLMLSKEDPAIIFKENTKFETPLNRILAEEVRNLLLNEQAS
jgi:CRP-like cAMP-binding protein